jgi:hypothetical protein
MEDTADCIDIAENRAAILANYLGSIGDRGSLLFERIKLLQT